MRKWLAAAVIAACLIVVISQQGQQEISPQNDEFSGKQSVLEQDMETTRELYVRQCLLTLDKTLAHLQRAPDETSGRNVLKRVHDRYPEWRDLVWYQPGGSAVRTIADDRTEQTGEDHFRQAREALSQNSQTTSYRSPLFHSGATNLQVIGVRNHDHMLIALIPHLTTDKLKAQQEKHLHMVIYPHEQSRSRMQTVDPDTTQPIPVRTPEQNEGASHMYEGEVVVKFKQHPDAQRLERMLDEIECVHMRKLNGAYVFRSKSKTTRELMHYFQRKNVVYVEPHYMYFPNEVSLQSNEDAWPNENTWQPNDELFDPYQWNLPLVAALEGWNITRGNEQITIAVLDTGIDLDHTDLQQNLVEGANMIDENRPPLDEIGHGTHVAGVISATVNNGEGIAGMSWYNRIMPVKVLDETGMGSSYAVARGIIWATDHGAKVINMSLGNYADAEFLHDAIRYAYERDVLLVAATGNDNTEQPGYPAAYPEVLAVAANDANQNRAVFSNYGDYVDVSAPGVNIASTFPGNRYAAMSGTSMASPHAAALAGLIRSVRPELSNAEVMEIIRHTATDLGEPGKDLYFGYGQIDVHRALNYVAHQQKELSVPEATAEDSPLHWLRQKWEQLRSIFP